jgi:hypothetical protein
MKRQLALTVLLLAVVTLATPCAAQQAPASPLTLPIEPCAGCFAYLVFPPSLEPELYAIHGQATEASASLPAARDPDRRLWEQSPSRLATSE